MVPELGDGHVPRSSVGSPAGATVPDDEGTNVGPTAHRAVRTGSIVALTAAVWTTIAVIAVGIGSVLTQDGAVAATETWTPIRAEASAPPITTTFGAPNDVHYASDGSLLVADFSSNGLLRRAVDGTWSVVAPFGTAQSDMWNPSAVTTTADGRILVAEAGRKALAVLAADGTVLSRDTPAPTNRAVSELAATGATVFATAPGSGFLFTSELGSGSWSTVPGPWTNPSGVALSPDGATVTVSDAGTDEVWQLDRATGSVSALRFPGDAQARLRGVAVDGGDVFAVDNGHGVLWARTAGAWIPAFSAAPDGSPLVNPTGVSVGPGRELVVADYNRQRVVTAASSGRANVAPDTSPSPDPDATSEPGATPTPELTTTPVPSSLPAPEPSVEPTTPQSTEPTAPLPPAVPTAVPIPGPAASTTPLPSSTAEPVTDPTSTARSEPTGADGFGTDDPDTDGTGSTETMESRVGTTAGDANTSKRTAERELAWTGSAPVAPTLVAAAVMVGGGTLLRLHHRRVRRRSGAHATRR